MSNVNEMNNAQLFERSKQLVPGGVHSPVRSFKGLHTTPRFVNEGNGAYIKDAEGKEYVDFCMSFGPLILGHQDPIVKEKLITALDRGWTFGACEKYSLELAEHLLDRLPHAQQIRFVNSGTEAVMTATRIARGYTGKNKIIKFNGCYHGHLDSMLIKAGSGLAGTAEASSKGVPESIAGDTLICELADIETVKACFNDHQDNVAAIIVEPLPANNGLLEQDLSFLKELRELCDKNNSLLIFDEVISGFRVAFGGMAEKTGIKPDMVTLGKIIGGGMPVGAIASSREIMESLAPVGGVYQAGTLSANPLAMVAGLETLKQLTNESYAKLEEYSANICTLFADWFEKNGFEDYAMLRASSLFWAVPTKERIQNVGQIPENLGSRFFELFEILLNKGIYLSPNAYEVGFVSLAHNEKVQEDIKNRLWS